VLKISNFLSSSSLHLNLANQIQYLPLLKKWMSSRQLSSVLRKKRKIYNNNSIKLSMNAKSSSSTLKKRESNLKEARRWSKKRGQKKSECMNVWRGSQTKFGNAMIG
jgi:hypothetical protein